jgi:hypothetical protein
MATLPIIVFLAIITFVGSITMNNVSGQSAKSLSEQKKIFEQNEKTISALKAKSFKADLSALETQVVKLQPITTDLDYGQLDTVSAVSPGILSGVLDPVKINALAASSNELPKKVGFDTSKDGVQITLITQATAPLVKGYWCIQPETTKACEVVPANAVDDELANQLGSIYFNKIGKIPNIVSVIARPVDIALLYTTKLITNEVNYPKVLPTAGFSIGSKYQDRSFSNTATSLNGAQGLATTDAVTGINLFPNIPDKPGYYFLVEGQTLLYSGTDARISDTQTVHTSFAFEEK